MIVVAVAIFLAAIVGVGMALLYPGVDPELADASAAGVREINPTEYLRPTSTEPLIPEDLQELPEVTFGLTDADTEVEPEQGAEQLVEQDTDSTQISQEGAPITRPVTVAPRQSTAPVTHEPAVSAPAAARRSTPATAAPERTQPTAPATAAAATTRSTAPVRVTEYWIQLIASPSRDRVEQANVRLSDVNLSGRVTTRQVDNTLYYRLRVGPYSSQDEAEKFLEWIGELDGFENAYISEEYPLRS